MKRRGGQRNQFHLEDAIPVAKTYENTRNEFNATKCDMSAIHTDINHAERISTEWETTENADTRNSLAMNGHCESTEWDLNFRQKTFHSNCGELGQEPLNTIAFSNRRIFTPTKKNSLEITGEKLPSKARQDKATAMCNLV